MNGKRTMRDSFDAAIRGLVEVLQTQRNMKFHFLAAIAILIISLFLNLTKIELIVLAFAIVLVLITEIINTIVEFITDLFSPEFSDIAGMVKDISAGAVLLSAINAAVTGYLLFFTRLIPKFPTIVFKVQQAPPHLTFIAIVLVVFLVLIAKARAYHSGKLSFLRGGMPSGHSAVAFACLAVVVFMSGDLLISTLTFFLSFLVSLSRIREKVHNVKEVVVGAVLGFLVTISIFQLFS
ncbi:hypothetical protein AUJ66_07685 [Candidatus Desantisbacteria bacterium CG1_02_38_46]|uniref:Diacylglycerol kinase n=3 Tax=unclassified Candidatus Desantisiibacteriota TaxID=3106372 RepID=A0A2H9PDE2_9BACT|nr:MAG: hypothetical protein AUJ66_07685 [Candidatus Desantisbacteria bacterium CG1_02_38_46]PIU51549.1 MAG: diacylglycerol kinase [Candidatus Desantisbacteria bacterium CG07_land_8_20_14_0_80_39_15]PIZ16452.1 MAG: diacylglycerol kinase [Candidatus Desantisbacteria bacterium CG_4_10_14_0_8_um_filter_39_17]